MVVRFNKAIAFLFILGGSFIVASNLAEINRGQLDSFHLFFACWGIFIGLLTILFFIPLLYTSYLVFEPNRIVLYQALNRRKAYQLESTESLTVKNNVIFIQTPQGVEMINSSRFFVNQKDWKQLIEQLQGYK